MSVCIVASRFNQDIVGALVAGAKRKLEEAGVSDVAEYWVSGAFELPVVAARLATRGNVRGIIALGAVIRGDTPHFDYVCQGCTQGLMDVSVRYTTPVAFGVLTVNTHQQAAIRASRTQMQVAADHQHLQAESNKGYEAADALLETLTTLDTL